jgi:hypothetical protein
MTEATMVRTVMMTKDQIAELVALAHADAALWEQLKDRELEIEKRLADAAKQGREIDDPQASHNGNDDVGFGETKTWAR